MLNVVALPDSLLDVPAKLRKLADDTEAGKYGQPGTCVVAMLADRMQVFSFGPESNMTAAHVVLHAAMLLIAQELVDHGK